MLLGLAFIFYPIFDIVNDVLGIPFYFRYNKVYGLDGVTICGRFIHGVDVAKFRIFFDSVVFTEQ